MKTQSQNYRGQTRPLTEGEIEHFQVTDAEISKVRDLMGDDAHRVTRQDIARLRGLRGQNAAMGGHSLGMTADGFERFSCVLKLDRHSTAKPRRRGFAIPRPPEA